MPKLRLFQTLRSRVTAVFLLVSMAPLGIVSLFSARTAYQVVASIVTNQLENLATEKQDLLERWIGERRADVEVVAGSSLVREMDPAQLAPHLELVRRQYRVYRRFIVARADGQVVYDSDGPAEARCDGQPWHRRAMAGESYMSDVSLEPDGRQSIFRLSAPVREPGGPIEGVVCATVNTEAILGRVLNVSLGETGECYLVDRTGTFLAHKEPRRILRENIARSESFTNIFGGSRVGPIYTDYRGIAVLGASRAIGGTPWYLVVEQDRDEAFAQADALMRRIYAAIALTAVLAMSLSWLSAGYVAGPIRSLSEAAHGLARGEYDHPLLEKPSARRDEIGALHAAFRHMAGQLRDRHVRLQRQVGQTQSDLREADDKLRRTVDAAARSEHLAALGRLASGVAHEIRTPLTSLKLFLQSVQEEIDISPEHGEDYRIAMRQVGRIENTINHFLDFARPKQPVLAEVDFPRLLDDALVVVQPRANQQEVEVVASIAPGLPKVEGDMRQLGEALVNLLDNALAVMPDGGRLSLAVEREVFGPDGAERPGVRIDVADTGPGIPEQDRDRLFEPFFTTKAAGSGLGLAIVRGTVQLHGGTVSLHSRPGAGATFSIHLPGEDM